MAHKISNKGNIWNECNALGDGKRRPLVSGHLSGPISIGQGATKTSEDQTAASPGCSQVLLDKCSYYSPCGYDSCQDCILPTSNRKAVPDLFWDWRPACWPSLGPISTKLPEDLAPASAGIAALTLRGGEPLQEEEETETGAWVRQETHVRVPVCTQPSRRVIEVKRKRRIASRANYGVLKRVERRDSVLSLPSGSKLDAILNSETDQPTTKNRSDNKFSVLEDEDLDQPGCKFKKRNTGRAVALAKFFAIELDLEADLKSIKEVECGGVRPAVRGCFGELSVLQELSVKTSQKVEKSCCDNCMPRFAKKIVDWRRNMKKEVEIDPDHLERYKRLFRMNVPKGWNSKKYPYVPNGHSARDAPRSVGGNWNREAFAPDCAYSLVFSSGKPRVVTSYSSFNSEILYPLHKSLYSYLQRRKWLLVGDPTSERVEWLNGSGQFLSFDYIGATDNIKVEYVRAGIEILIDQSEDMSEQEKQCLRVLGDLRLYDRYPCLVGDTIEKFWDDNYEDYYEHMKDFYRGQPMGSFMSFPLLCLTNKTIVDLSLTDLLENKSLTFKEWAEHRCLVNGDDLLLREPNKKSNLRDRIIFNGGQVGMETNREKCLNSDTMAEVNSTLFINNEKQVKSNAKAMFPEKMTEDFLGMAKESCATIRGFIRCVRSNTALLARQKDKFLWKLPYPYQAACRKDKKIRKALMMEPIDKYSEVRNPFGVAEKPVDYNLNHDEEIEIIRDRVNTVRDGILYLKKEELADKFEGVFVSREKKKIRVVKVEKSWRSLTKRKKRSTVNLGLQCCVDAYYERRIRDFVDSDAIEFLNESPNWRICDISLGQLMIDIYEDKGSCIQRLHDFLRSSKSTLDANSPVLDNLCRDYISFCDK